MTVGDLITILSHYDKEYEVLIFDNEYIETRVIITVDSKDKEVIIY